MKHTGSTTNLAFHLERKHGINVKISNAKPNTIHNSAINTKEINAECCVLTESKVSTGKHEFNEAKKMADHSSS